MYVKLPDQHRVVKELVGFDFKKAGFQNAKIKQEPEEVILRDTRKEGVSIFRGHKWCVLLVVSDWSAFCETLHVEVEQENWEHVCNTLR